MGVVAGPGGNGVVWVPGLAAFAWDAVGEGAGRRRAAGLHGVGEAASTRRECHPRVIDGHTRAYFDKRDIQKMNLARLQFPGPAAEETWVTGSAGWTGGDGREHAYERADTMTEVTISEGEHKGRVLEWGQVTRCQPGDTSQVHILTTSPAAALLAAVLYRMTSRRREENYFRYSRAHFALDALETCATTPEEPARMVPNPAKKTAAAAVKTEKKTLTVAENARGTRLAALRHPGPGTATVITNQALARLDGPSTPPAATCKPPRLPPGPSPAKIPLSEHNPDRAQPGHGETRH